MPSRNIKPLLREVEMFQYCCYRFRRQVEMGIIYRENDTWRTRGFGCCDSRTVEKCRFCGKKVKVILVE